MRELTPAHIDFLERVQNGRKLKLADRKEDRVRQACRKAGLVEVLPEPRRWFITSACRAALLRSKEQEKRDA